MASASLLLVSSPTLLLVSSPISFHYGAPQPQSPWFLPLLRGPTLVLRHGRTLFGHALHDSDVDDTIVSAGQGDFARDHFANVPQQVAQCHVEIVSWRERFIVASILVEAPSLKVWKVLTDYERLSEFIPNLVCSEKLPCPYPGRIWLLQRGSQRTMYWNIEAHVILDLQEHPDMETGSELHFSMVDGDFKRYDGKWYLRPGPRPQTTMLHYEVNVVPKLFFPAAFVENIIKADLPRNLYAIAKRAETILEVDSELMNNQEILELPEQVSIANCNVDSSLSENICIQKENNSLATTKLRSKKGIMDEGRFFGVPSKEYNDMINLSAPYFWNGLGSVCQLSQPRIVDEIHFRRLDDLLENGGIHRQVVATVTVNAPSKDVWAVLTAYEELPKFIPNLTKSVVLFRDKQQVRLLQEGCKRLLYVVLHAQVVLDLFERPEQEIVFKQVEGDFCSFEGNWTLNQFGSRHTVLKYTVDTKFQGDCALAESLVEEVVYEDLPSNLCAIRDRAENLATLSNSSPICIEEVSVDPEQPESMHELLTSSRTDTAQNTLDSITEKKSKTKRCKSRRKRASHKRLMTDYGALERELKNFIVAYGTEGIMPLRKHMRQYGRSDLEKAVTAMGGFRTIALRMKLSLAYKERKPDGYWDEVQNLRKEIIAVQKKLGGDPTVLPSRLSIERSGHYALARAFEKWGGARETAKILGLKTRAVHKQEQKSKKTRSGSSEEAAAVVVDATFRLTPKDKKYSSVDEPCVLDSRRDSHASAAYLREASEITSDVSSPSSISEDVKVESEGEDVPSPTGCEEPNVYSNELKPKKMPLKTDVPQESSKWLTLFKETS